MVQDYAQVSDSFNTNRVIPHIKIRKCLLKNHNIHIHLKYSNSIVKFYCIMFQHLTQMSNTFSFNSIIWQAEVCKRLRQHSIFDGSKEDKQKLLYYIAVLH